MIRKGRPARTALLPAIALCVLALLGACKSGGTTDADAPDILPSYTDLARVHNGNVARFDTLWASVVSSIVYTDAEGKTRREQGEGHLQLVKPSRVALSIGKLGEVIVWVGVNEERFWIIEPTNEPPSAVTGSHDSLTDRARDRLGLPVAPSTLVDALGLSAIPLDAQPIASFDAERGEAVYTVGDRLYGFRLEDGRLARIEFLDPEGVAIARSVFTGAVQVELPDESGFYPRIAERAEVTDLATGDSVRLKFSEARERSIRERVFDPDFLFGAYRIERVRDLDE